MCNIENKQNELIEFHQRMLFNEHFPEVSSQKLIKTVLESFTYVIRTHYHQNDINQLRKLFMSQQGINQDDELLNQVIVHAKSKIDVNDYKTSIILLSKFIRHIVNIELNVIRKYFTCSSLSQLLHYFCRTDMKYANETIQMRTNYFIRPQVPMGYN